MDGSEENLHPNASKEEASVDCSHAADPTASLLIDDPTHRVGQLNLAFK